MNKVIYLQIQVAYKVTARMLVHRKLDACQEPMGSCACPFPPPPHPAEFCLVTLTFHQYQEPVEWAPASTHLSSWVVSGTARVPWPALNPVVNFLLN